MGTHSTHVVGGSLEYLREPLVLENRKLHHVARELSKEVRVDRSAHSLEYHEVRVLCEQLHPSR